MDKSFTTKKAHVAVIMLNWNTPEMTISAIKSVLASDYPDFRIHLTDNGSMDNSYKLFQDEFGDQINLYRLENNRGYVGGMNHCLAEARKSNPRYFLIMNNDTILEKSAISNLVKIALSNEDKCVVTGKVYFYDEPDMLQTVGNEFDRRTMNERRIGYGLKDSGQFDQIEEREMIDDIFMLLPASIYDQVGGYSTYFYLNYEQTDLIIRIRDKGFKVIYTPDAKLWHKGSFSTGGLGNPYMMFWEGKSKLIIHYLYQSGTSFWLFYFGFLFKILWQYSKEVIKVILGKKSRIKSAAAIIKGFLSGTGWLFTKKTETGYNPYA